jgi:sulfur-oxidizing protein SoxX
MLSARTIAALLFAACAMRVIGAQSGDVTIGRVEEVMRESFSTATPEQWRTRLAQDQAQALCSRYRDTPPPEVSGKIATQARASMRYPRDGKLMRDWREGEKLASTAGGGHISAIQPEPSGQRRGGNCYACHALATKEVAAGDLGPSLTHYGALRGHSPETVKFVYEKIYNAQASFPCSLMPRFGHNGWLTPEEIADAVAFLLDPDSPVNK